MEKKGGIKFSPNVKVTSVECHERVRVETDRLRSISSTHTNNAESFHYDSKRPEYYWRTNMVEAARLAVSVSEDSQRRNTPHSYKGCSVSRASISDHIDQMILSKRQ
jgi:hypothetical protein